MTLFDELSKPAYAGMSDQEAADAINALRTVPAVEPVYGSFRTLGHLLTEAEYNLLRDVLDGLAASSRLVADMVELLKQPGDTQGNRGGLPLNDEKIVAKIAAIASNPELQGALAGVPAKIDAYCQTFQPQPQPVFPFTGAHHVQLAREAM